MASPTFLIPHMGKVEERAVDLSQAVLIIAQAPANIAKRYTKQSFDEILDIQKVKLRRHKLVDSTGKRADIFAYWPEIWKDEWGVREFMKHVLLKYPTMPYLVQYKLSEK